MTILGAPSGSDPNSDTALMARTVATRYKLVNDTSPWLSTNPELVAAMAQDPSIDNVTLATRAASVAGMANMDGLHERLKQLDGPTQRALFAQLTGTQQQALGSLGYSAPKRQASSGGFAGFLDDAFGDVGHAVGTGLGAVGGAIKDVAGEGLHYLNVIGSEPAHLYRTIRTMDVDEQLLAFGGALVAGVGMAAGIAAAPFTGGLSLGATAGLIGLGSLIGGNAAVAITNPTDWWDSYRSTYDGEKTFLASAQRRANELLGNNSTIVNLAKDIAFEGGITELAREVAGTAEADDPNVILGSVQRVVDKMLDPTDPRYNDTLSKLSQIAQTDDFQEAVATLQNGKISFGRDIARGLGLEPGSKWYNIASGAADGIWLITMDPLLIGGALGEVNRIRRFTIPVIDGEQTFQYVKKLSDTNTAVRRSHEIMAAAVETGDFGMVKRMLPESQTMWDDLLTHRDEVWRADDAAREYTREGLLDFFHSSAGFEALLSGKSTVKGQTTIMLSNTGRIRGAVGKPWSEFKDWAHTTINMADSNNSSKLMQRAMRGVDPEAWDEVARLRVTQESALPKSVLSDVTDVFAVGPKGGAEAMSLRARGSISFEWSADPALSTRFRNTKAIVDWIDRRPIIGSIERQAGALMATMTNMIPETNLIVLGGDRAAMQVDKFVDLGRVAGMRSDTREAWRAFILNQSNGAARAAAIEGYIGTMLEVGGAGITDAGAELASRFIEKSHQVFALGGSDILTIAGRERRVGVLPVADQAYALAMPDLKELRQAVQKGSFMKYVFNTADAPILDSAMSKIWKPAVLLRLGFIPRAAGEELLAFFAREGVSKYLAGFGEREVARGQLRAPGDTLKLLKSVDPDAYVTQQLTETMEHWNVLSQLRPFEWMANRSKFARPAVGVMERYTDWVRDGLEHGFLPESMTAWVPEGMRNALLGKDRSLRRMLLTGIEPDVQRANIAFEGGFAKGLLDATSAQTAGIYDAGTHARDLATVPIRDPKTGELKHVPAVKFRGQYHYMDPTSTFYVNGYHSSVAHLTSDPVVSHALGATLPRVRPKGISEVAAEELHSMYQAINDPVTRSALGLVMNGREVTAEQIDALLVKARQHLRPKELKELTTWLPAGGADPHDVLEALRHVRDDAYVNEAQAVLGRLNAMSPNQRGWAQLYLNHRPELVDETQKYWLTANQAKQQMNDLIRAQQLSPAMQDYLKGSMHNLQSPDGTPVARILNRPRTYFPTLHQTNAERLVAGITNDAAVQAAAAAGGDLARAVRTAMKERYRALPNLMHKSPESFQQADMWIDQFVARHFDGNAEKINDYVRSAIAGTPDRAVVFTGDYALQDPRVASDLSKTMQSFIGGKGTANGSGAAFMENLRGRETRYIDNPLLVNGRAELVPNGSQFHTLADGTTVHGISVEQSAAEWAQVIQERANQLLREDVQTALVARAPMYRGFTNGDRKMEFVRVQPDEAIAKQGMYFADAAGKKSIAWGDTNFMQAGQVEHGDGWLFDQAGPALRDFLDETSGLAYRTSDGRRLLHYSTADVGANTGHLPNMIYGQLTTPPRQLGKLENVVQFGFNKVISPAIDAIARTPMAHHNFVEAYITNMKASNWLMDRELIDDALPRIFNRAYDGALTGATRRDELVRSAQTNSRFFDQDISSLSDSDTMAYLSQLSEEQIQQVTARALSAIGPSRQYDSMVAMLDLKRTNPSAFKHGVDGIDANLEFTRDLLERYADLLDYPSWATAATSRERMFLEHDHPDMYRAMANGGWDALKSAKTNLEHVDRRVLETAQERAIVNTVPFLDSHEIKSQFAEYGKGLMPFWYAEENFFKRWGRTLLLNPDAIRKGQLTYMGMKSVGIVQTDANGQDWFVYPGSDALVQALSAIPGLGAVPFDAAFRTRTTQLLPGFSENVGTPSFAPLVTFPLSFATQFFPELGSLQSAIVGKQNVNRSLARQFIPTQIQNFWDAATADESNKRFASAMMTAAQYMEAHGQGLAPEADAAGVEDYLDDLRASARTILIAQAMGGFVSPGAPSLVVDGGSNTALRKEYLDLVRQQGIEDGTAQYIANHRTEGPSALVNPLAYSVGQTESVSGAPLPATDQAVAFYHDNADWLTQNPLAGAWLLPPDRTGGKLEQDAYNQQTIDGLRIARTPEDFVRTMRFKGGATEYFRAQDEYKLLVKQANLAGDREARADADQQWLQFSTQYKAMHPVFAEELVNGDGRARRRNTIDQLRISIEDPEAPKPWHFEAIKTVIETFTAYQAQLSDLSASRSADAMAAVDALKQRYGDVMDRYIYDHPEVESLWSSVLRPEASLDS